MHVVELLLDGKQVCPGYQIDPEGVTSYPGRKVTFHGWQKSEHGNTVSSDFVYERSSAADEADDDAGSGLASGAVDWSRGVLSLRVHAGVKLVFEHDTYGAQHNPDMTRARSLSEKAMIKGGHSASAGAGAKHFSQKAPWRAGQVGVSRAPGGPCQPDMNIYYRDSFFLLLRGDESKVRDTGTAQSDAGFSQKGARVRNNVRKAAETEKALSKRPKMNEVIDLTDD